MSPNIVPATLAHAERIAPRLRLEDVLEIRRAGLISPLQVVKGSLEMSLDAWVWLVDGEPAAIFGVAGNTIDREAMIWLLTSDLVTQHKKTFWKLSRDIVRLMSEAHPNLGGYCDARYAASVRWLRRLGFTLTGPEPYGSIGMPFYRFTMER